MLSRGNKGRIMRKEGRNLYEKVHNNTTYGSYDLTYVTS